MDPTETPQITAPEAYWFDSGRELIRDAFLDEPDALATLLND